MPRYPPDQASRSLGWTGLCHHLHVAEVSAVVLGGGCRCGIQARMVSGMSGRRHPPVHRPSYVRVAALQLAVLPATVAATEGGPVPGPYGNRTANAVVLVVVAIALVGITAYVLATGRSDNPVLFVGGAVAVALIGVRVWRQRVRDR